MPLNPNHILKFLENRANDRSSSEMFNLLIEKIDTLCFKECEIDRVSCTLNPMCRHRWLLNFRIKSGLNIEDLPKFCYSVHKNIIFRDFRNKTVIYRPLDAYLYLVDFLDIFFHGDYRKLNKFISFKEWDSALKIFDYRITKQNENFHYHLTDNYMIFKYDDRIHVIFINEKYVLCNANRETIHSLELLKGLCELYAKINIPDVSVKLKDTDKDILEVTTIIPSSVLSHIKNEPIQESEAESKLDLYFWYEFAEDLNTLMRYSKEINVQMNRFNNLEIKLFLTIEPTYSDESKLKISLRYRDLWQILDVVSRIYNDFYVIKLGRS